MTVAAAPSVPRKRKGLFLLRLFLGLLALGGLTYFLWTPGDWANKVFVWVLLTILADECAGWFGYIGLALGALVFLAPGATPEQWFAAFPLVLGSLFALLLVKHSGGPFVLPFAGAVFAGAVLAAPKLGDLLGTPIKVLESAELRRTTLIPMAAALAFSFVRQIVAMLIRWQKRRRAEQALLSELDARVPAPTAPVQDPAHVSADPPAPPSS